MKLGEILILVGISLTIVGIALIFLEMPSNSKFGGIIAIGPIVIPIGEFAKEEYRIILLLFSISLLIIMLLPLLLKK